MLSVGQDMATSLNLTAVTQNLYKTGQVNFPSQIRMELTRPDPSLRSFWQLTVEVCIVMYLCIYTT